MNPIHYTRHEEGITMFSNGKHSTVSSSHPNFEKILDALKKRQYEYIDGMLDIRAAINKYGNSTKKNRRVYAKDKKVYWIDSKGNHKEMHGTLVDRIVSDIGYSSKRKFADALLAFMDNIQKNKRKDIRDELYDWLMSGKNPITYDGCFLAYKKIRNDYTDIYTGLMDNSPGKFVRMNQSDVDQDRHRVCSTGLHFCSLEYLNKYHGNNHTRVVIVKVNPRHVFAIPVDYNFQKGRASEYYVVGEYEDGWKHQIEAFKSSFVDEDNKQESMPQVKFATGWMQPSLKSLSEGFGLIFDGKVLMCENKLLIATNSYIKRLNGEILANDLDLNFRSITAGDTIKLGNEFVIKVMSPETKSVRAALKSAIYKLSKHHIKL